MKKITIFVCLICLLYSCGPSRQEYNKIEEENKQLKTTIDSLQTELDNYQYSPKKLCQEAQKYYQADARYDLEQTLKLLEKYHIDSEEYIKTKALWEKKQKEIAEIERKMRLKQEAEERARLQAVNKLKKKYDDVSGITWYYNPYFTHYTNTNHTSLYMGRKGNSQPWLRLMMSYEGDTWIFFEKAYLSYDGHTQQIFFDKYKDKKSENDTRVWEWIDVSVDQIDLGFIRLLIDGKSAKMRLSGKYEKTKALTATELKAMKEMIQAYDVLVEESQK